MTARRPKLDQLDNSGIVDLFVIGGGINGCGIARDAAGRGLSVELAEMNDLASATSSASTKLFHGGLRYLEYWEIGLVRSALIEREVLLKAMPHISWPMRFVLPYHKDMRFEGDTPTSKLLCIVMPWMKGRRPAWLIRFRLFLYDNLGGRQILKGTTSLKLAEAPEGILILFLDDGRIEMDSNAVERTIRPIALQRKNALFAGHDAGAQNWAMLASLIETCKLNRIEPHNYLTGILTAILNGHKQKDIDQLLPWNSKS